jgi:hypothetical protein
MFPESPPLVKRQASEAAASGSSRDYILGGKISAPWRNTGGGTYPSGYAAPAKICYSEQPGISIRDAAAHASNRQMRSLPLPDSQIPHNSG